MRSERANLRLRRLSVMPDIECFCGDKFATREELTMHNVDQHDMTEDESRQRVLDKYPGAS